MRYAGRVAVDDKAGAPEEARDSLRAELSQWRSRWRGVPGSAGARCFADGQHVGTARGDRHKWQLQPVIHAAAFDHRDRLHSESLVHGGVIARERKMDLCQTFESDRTYGIGKEGPTRSGNASDSFFHSASSKIKAGQGEDTCAGCR